jgi:hypothetical protein
VDIRIIQLMQVEPIERAQQHLDFLVPEIGPEEQVAVPVEGDVGAPQHPIEGAVDAVVGVVVP